MRNTKQNGENIKNSPKMALRGPNTIYQEWNNTPSTPNLLENDEKSLIDTIRKKVKEEFQEHETKINEMISNNLENTNGHLDKIYKEMTELTKSLELRKTN